MAVRIEDDNPKRKPTKAEVRRQRQAEAREAHREAIRAGRAADTEGDRQ